MVTAAWAANRVAAKFRAWRFLDRQSARYWSRSTDTYKASADYYARRMRMFASVLATLPAARDALDVGCGDGECTFMIAQHARHVVGLDIGGALVSAATHEASRRGVINVTFV